jgi:hypothetical protein
MNWDRFSAFIEHSRSTSACVLLVAAALFTPISAIAWGGDGHRIVCAIAWDEMQPDTRDHVQRLLGVEGREAFADTCTWADDYRNHGHRETADWHFLNVPRSATKVDISRDCDRRKSCVVAQITKDERILRGSDSDEDKTKALKFLAHFVGDIHQPLHISHAVDKGGNAIEVRFLNRKSNMHAVWDKEMLRATHEPWQQIANELTRRITLPKRREWAASEPLQWANESLAIANAAETEYRPHGGEFHLGEDYERRELPVVFDRLMRAGVRLGAALDHELQ